MASLSKELVLLVIQFLKEENLMETMHKLEQESGLYFNLKYFEERIMSGDWDEVEKYLNGFTKLNENRFSMKMYFEIRKQKYFEALDRRDRTTALEILVKDLKIFSTYNEDLYKEITNLITLENFRENEQLSRYGDARTTRMLMMVELRKLIDLNPLFNDKLIFPPLKTSRLRHLINQSLNWQHQLCRDPKPNPDISTLLVDHTCSPPVLLPVTSATNHLSYASLGGFHFQPLTHVPIAPRPNASEGWMRDPKGTSSSSQSLAAALASSSSSQSLAAALASSSSSQSLAAALASSSSSQSLAAAIASSSSSQSLAAALASSLAGPSNPVFGSKHPRTLNTLELMDSQNNGRDNKKLRRVRSSKSFEEAIFRALPQPNSWSINDLPRTVICTLHQGSNVTSMEFNPFFHSLLAVGCENGEVSFWETGLRERLTSKPFEPWNLSTCSIAFQAIHTKDSSISINRVSWSPDGVFLGVAFSKHLVHLYTYQTPNDIKQHVEIDAHDGGVNDLGFSYPNNKLCFVTCGDDKLIKVWDLNGNKTMSFEGHVASVYSVLPSQKEHIQFCFSTSVDGKVRAWMYENQTFHVEYDTPGKCSTKMLYSSDGTRLFSCGTSKDGESFLVEWDEPEGAIKRTYSGFGKKSVGMVQFDSTKSRFLAAGEDNQVKFWDMDVVNVLASTDAEGGLPNLPRLKFNKEGNLLAVSTADGGFKVLANADGIKFLRNIEASKEPFFTKSPGGLVSIGRGRDININSDEGSKSWELTEIVHPVQCRIVTVPEGMGSNNKVACLVYTNSGNGLLALGSKGVQKLWKWSFSELNPTGKATASVVPQHWRPSNGILMTNDVPSDCEMAVPCIALSRNDSYAMAACGGNISLFNMVSFKVLFHFLPPPPVSTCVVFSPQDNNVVAVGRADSNIQIFNVRLYQARSLLKGHQKYITGIVFSLRLNIMVSSGADAQIFSWNMDTWNKKKSVAIKLPSGENAPAGETKLEFHIDQIKLLTCHETQLAIYDASKLELICRWVPQDVLPGAITSAVYSCNGRLVYATFTDGNVGVFDAETLKPRCRIASSAYIHQSQTPSNSQNVYPVVVAAHPHEPNQFAIGLSDGSIKVIEPPETEGWQGIKVPVVNNGN